MAAPLTPEQLEPIRQAVFAGNKIEAIKLYRSATNLGLAESKEAVEKLEAQWRAETPEQFKKPAAAGCFSLFLLAAVGVWAVANFVLSR